MRILKIEQKFKFIFLLFFALIISCIKKTEIGNSVEFEKKVFDDIFVQTVDSTLIDMRTYTGFQYSEKERDSIKKDTLNRIIAFEVENYKVPNDFLTQIPKNYKTINDSVWKFQLEKFNNQKYKFKNSSELPTENELIEWQKKYPKFSGELGFSKIHFDDSRENGVFEATYYCGSKCGLGFLVYIKKINNKWEIQKVEQSWIS